jgi:hypothetical protein
MRRTGAVSRIFAVAVLAEVWGCEDSCPPTSLLQEMSPSRQYSAGVYTYDCGPVPPFNAYVGLSRRDEKPTQIASIVEAPMEPRPKWLSDTELQVVFDCSLEAEALCAPSPGRHWSVTKSAKWRDVRITYVASDKLRARLSAADVERLLR